MSSQTAVATTTSTSTTTWVDVLLKRQKSRIHFATLFSTFRWNKLYWMLARNSEPIDSFLEIGLFRLKKVFFESDNEFWLAAAAAENDLSSVKENRRYKDHWETNQLFVSQGSRVETLLSLLGTPCTLPDLRGLAIGKDFFRIEWNSNCRWQHRCDCLTVEPNDDR